MEHVGKKYVRKNIPWRKLGDEGVLVNRDQQKILVLNDVGTFIWRCLETPCALEELVQKVQEEYDVDEDTARRDVEEFLKMLLDFRLVD